MTERSFVARKICILSLMYIIWHIPLAELSRRYVQITIICLCELEMSLASWYIHIWLLWYISNDGIFFKWWEYFGGRAHDLNGFTLSVCAVSKLYFFLANDNIISRIIIFIIFPFFFWWWRLVSVLKFWLRFYPIHLNYTCTSRNKIIIVIIYHSGLLNSCLSAYIYFLVNPNFCALLCYRSYVILFWGCHRLIIFLTPAVEVVFGGGPHQIKNHFQFIHTNTSSIYIYLFIYLISMTHFLPWKVFPEIDSRQKQVEWKWWIWVFAKLCFSQKNKTKKKSHSCCQTTH